METIKKQAVQLLSTSELSLKEEPKEKAVSLYGSGRVSAECLALNLVRLKRAFPKLPDGWYDILEEFIDLEGFTDKRLTDAVNNLIRTCPYPEPTPANLLGYDKKAELYTYQELQEKYKAFYYAGAKSDPIGANYSPVKVNGELRWVLKEYKKYFGEAQ